MSVPRDWNPPTPLTAVAFHGVVGEFVGAIESHTEADPAGLLVQLLTAIGSLIGPGAHFIAERDRHPARLFAVLVGESSKGRKGSSWSHVRDLLQRVDLDLSKRVQSGLSSGEGLIWAVRDPVIRREAIRERGRVVGYESVQADPGIADKRLLVYESELASALRVIERDGNTLSAQVRLAWDSGDLRVLTKESPAQATGAHISILGHVTADELRRYLGRTEAGNGFANRFLWIFVRRSKVLPEGGTLDPALLEPLVGRLRRGIEATRALGDREIRRDDGARALWYEVYAWLSEGKPGLLGSVVSRAEAQVMRLALLYALLDESTAIQRVHLEAALEVWRYADESARFIFGDSLGDPVADAILSALRSDPGGLTRAQINRLFTGHRGSADIGRALEALTKRSLAACERVSTGGRPAERWTATLGAKKEKEAEEVAGDSSLTSHVSPGAASPARSGGPSG
ncbi:MAG: DUF3987 domain-containing protein [Candidatus Limnocylindria bacterium]